MTARNKIVIRCPVCDVECFTTHMNRQSKVRIENVYCSRGHHHVLKLGYGVNKFVAMGENLVTPFHRGAFT